MDRKLNLSEICGLFGKGDRTVSKWIRCGAIRHKRTPVGYQVSPTSLFFFLATRKLRPNTDTAATPTDLLNGELVSIPEAARQFKMESAKPLYRAANLGEFACFDLSENESRGLRVFLVDVRRYLGAQPDLPSDQDPEPARGNGNGKSEPILFGSAAGLMKIADQRLAEAQEFKRDVETVVRAGREYNEAVQRLSRRLPGDWQSRVMADGEVIESGEQLQSWLNGVDSDARAC